MSNLSYCLKKDIFFPEGRLLCRTVNERRSWDNCAFIELEQKVYKLNTILPEWVRPANPLKSQLKNMLMMMLYRVHKRMTASLKIIFSPPPILGLSLLASASGHPVPANRLGLCTRAPKTDGKERGQKQLFGHHPDRPSPAVSNHIS